VGSVLGQGGFGITYRGADVRLQRPVAIKECFPSGCVRQRTTVIPAGRQTAATYADTKQKFLQEGQTLAQFDHVGIVHVFASFEENNTAYMVMEYLPGQTLAEVLHERGGRLRETEAVGYMAQICQALEVVHRAGVLHRDIKPENVMLCTDGRVVLMDFGTAREYAAGQTQSQSVALTPGYAPLEQYAYQAQRGPYTDVYALAATLYHLLTGEVPVAAPDRAVGVALPEVRQLHPHVSEAAAQAVKRGMEMQIAQRPQSVGTFVDLLKGSAPGTPPRPPVPPKPLPATIPCPHCRQVNDANEIYCQHCTRQLAVNRQCPHCRRSVPVAPYCVHCGHRL
jgi:serine/threonine protein kinase